ncbi:MAG: AAA family ATPase [Clostridia bacterium]|nr:AAA family ATPase [Clostridia bacterium]
MKTLYLIGGTMGVGKTTVSQILKRQLPACVLLDGDWCWDADPFVVTEETKRMVMGNIRHLLTAFLSCSAYENVVFCWVMHEQKIIDEILSALPLDGCQVRTVSLVCDADALTRRLKKDVALGLRRADVIGRSVARLPLYDALDTQKIDVSDITAAQAAQLIVVSGE